MSDNITNPSLFIVFAPAQSTGAMVSFTGTAAAPVTINKAGGATGGTHNNRKRINACMGDLHVENMLWSVFINNTNSSSDPSASQRWTP
jgi:prepilin-type processing-associated H-X9-DG protein